MTVDKSVILLLILFLLSGCACGSIPKAGPLEKASVERQRKPSIPSKKTVVEKVIRLELPAISNGDDVVEHLGYTASYNHEWLIPNWVAYELTREELNGTTKGEESFRWDPDIKGKQAWREDYSGSGWDKGHMIPRADLKWSAKAYSESFFFSNICPQNHDFNAGAWLTTEKMARRIARQYGSVYVVCGPIVTDNKYGTIGEHKVTVPDAFFKAFLINDEGEYSAIGIVMYNSPERQLLKASTMSVDELEEKCGLDLFSSLERTIQDEVESKINWHKWGI